MNSHVRWTDRARLGGALLLVLALLPFAVDGGVLGRRASAELIDSFTPPAYTTNTTGAIDIIGNAVMNCGTSTNCVETLAGTLNSGNGSFTMVNLDADDGVLPAAVSNTTVNSSAAVWSPPAGSTVLYASLHWSSQSNDADRNEISFLPPGASTYQTVTGTVSANGSLYQSTADVTSIVQASGPGTFWAGNVANIEARNRYAAWSLVVVYENPTLPVRNLSVFEGFGRVTSSFQQLDVPISGFLTPPFGAVNAEIGVVAYEGDRNIQGDQVLIDTDAGAGTNFVNLTDASNPQTNFGNGSISDAGAADVSGTPGYVNNLSIDIDEFATVNTLDNAATDTTIRFQTTGDWWYPGVLTTAIDLFVPEFPVITKTVTDLNGGDAVPGDVLEYSLFFTNTGNDGALNSVVRDPIPPNTTYVPGSLLVDGVSRSDAAGDDVGEFDGTEVIAYVGSGATSSSGGTLNPGDSAEVTFQVTVETPASGTTIENTGSLDYTAQTLGEDFSFDTNTVETPVPPLVDLSVVKSGSPDPAVPGEPVTWTVEVSNAGPNTATGVTVTESMTNATFASASGATCAASTGDTSFTCDLADIPAGDSVTFTITADTDPSLTDSDAVGNTAIADSNEDDDDATNNSGSAKLPIDPVADLSIEKSDDLDPAQPGDTVTYTLTVTNNGPSDAHNVQIVDGPPPGVTVTGISLVAPASGTCNLAANSCTVPLIAAGDTVDVEVTVTIDAATTGTITNTAKVSGEDPDPVSGNDSTTEDTEIEPVADIRVEKTTLDAPVVAGEQVTYRIRVFNDGPSTAAAVSVTDTLDPILTLVSAVPTQGSCPGSIACNLGAIASGAFADITVIADVAASASGTSLTNEATASSPTDSTPGNNTGSVTDTVANVSDLRLVKEVDQNPIVAGGTFEYILTVFNDGPSDTSAAITVVDDIPAPLVADSWSAGCGLSGSTVTCTSTDALAVGDSLVFTISGTVPADASAPSIDNIASVSYPNDPDPANDSAMAETDLAAEADVKIDKEWTTATATAGDTATFTLEVTNDGPSVSDNVVVTDALTSGMTFVSDLGGLCSGTTTVTCNLGDLAVDESVTITVTVQLPAELTAGLLANTASVTADTDDRNPSNNDDTDTVQVVREADLQITKAASDTTPVAGDVITYTVVITNDGPSTANGTFLGDPLPAGLTLQTASIGSSQGVCSDVAGAVSCDLGVIAVGALNAVTITYDALVDADVLDGTRLTNTATATSSDPDPTPATVDEDVDVVAESDLIVTKSASVDPATPGGTITYTIVIENDGLSDAQGVAIADPPPAGFTPTSATSTLGTCDLTVNCTVGTLAAGAQAIITITGDIDASVTGNLVNTTAPVTASTTLVNTGDDSGTVSVATEPRASLDITKSASPTTIDAGGGLVTFVVTVTNGGPSDAASVEVTDALPVGYVVDSVTPSQGTCSSNTSCQLGTVTTNGAPITITYVGSFPSTQPAGTVTNSVSASSPTDPSGPVTAEADVDITTSADVSVSKSGPLAVVAGDTVQYNIAVQNDGPSTATTVEVTDVLDNTLLDANAATVTLSPASAGTCANNAGTIECTFASVAVGSLATITIDADVRSSAPIGVDNLDNTATVTSGTDDPNATNDMSTTETDVNRSADLSVEKTKPAPTTFTAGEVSTYQIVLTNNGPSDADGVVIDDPAPAGVTFGAVTAVPNVCSALPCNVGTLANGDSVTLTIEATVDADSTDTTVDNTADVTSPTPDGDSSNDSSTITTPITSSADMVLESKNSAPDPVPAGGTLTYTVVARNDGPSTAANAVIVDTVPANTTLIASSLPTGCTTTGTAPGSVITCDLGDVDPTDSASVSFDVIVDSDLAAPATLSNTASTSSATADPDPSTASNEATEETTVGSLADVGIEKSADLATAVPGEELTYTLTVTNAGPSTARAVEVTDDISAIFDSGTVSTVLVGAPTGASCDNSVACGPFDMPVGTFTIEITGTVSADILAALNNSASVSTTTPQGDDDLPNTSAITTPVAPSADLEITKSATPDPVGPGDPITYTITVENLGSSDAQNVVVTDSLPADVTLDSISSPGGTCFSGSVSCTYPTVAAGDSVEITITGTVSDRAVDTIENSADVTSDTDDPDPDNNSTTIETDVIPEADLQLTKATVTSPVVAGETVRYTIDVFNNGPAAATDVDVIDTLPAGAAFVSVSSPVGTCSHDGSLLGGVLDCDLGTLGDQAAVQIVVDMLVEPDAFGDLENSATVSSPIADPVLGNETSATSDTIVTAPDLRILKSLTEDTLLAGEDFEYTIEVFNDGPSDALADIEVTDTLPAQVDVATVVLSNNVDCTFTAATRLVDCAFPADLEVGGVISFTITGTILSGATTVDVNTATVSTDDDDPNLDNNTAAATATLTTNADLVAAKSFNDASVIAGEQTTFTISVTNNGPSDAANTELVDNLPTGWTVVSLANATGGSCANTATAVTCTTPSLADGATMSVEVTALVGSTHPAGPQTNTAVADSDTEDRNPANNTAVDSISVTRLAQLAIEKEAAAPTVLAGNVLEYQITVSNSGPSSAEATVVGDALPMGVEIVPSSLAPGCSAPGNVITCDLGELLPGAAPVVFTYQVTFDPALINGTEIVNTAKADTITPQGEPAEDDATVTVETAADLEVVSKQVTPDPAIAGTTVTYTINVINNGPSVALNTVVSDDLPAGITAVAASLPAGCSVVGTDVECVLGTVEVDDPIAITFDALIDASVPDGDTLRNTASIGSDTMDPDDTNDSSFVDVAVEAVADVTIEKVANPSPVVPGEQITYTLTVTNLGPSNAQDVEVSDTTLAALDPLTINASSTLGTCDATVLCTLGEMEPGVQTVTITGDVLASVTAPIDNTANVGTSTTQPVDGAPDSSSITTPVAPEADLAIDKTLDTLPAVPGQSVQYTITVTNPGPSDSQNVVVTDSVDPAITGLAADDGSCSFTDQDLTCNVGTLAPGTFTVVVTGVLDASFTGTLSNLASVTTDTPQGDDTSPDTASVDEEVLPQADLELSKTATPDPVIAGEQVSYLITVVNNGPSTALDVVIDDVLPAGLTLDGVSSTVGACTALPCLLGEIPVGESGEVTVDATVDSAVLDLPANTATVTASTADPDPDDNAASADPEVDTLARLSTVKELTSGTPVAGESVEWTITVTNAGPSDALNVNVADSVPSNLTNVVVESSQGGCVAFDCLLGTIPALSDATITVTADLPADTPPGTLENTAVTTSDTPDDDNTDDTSTASDETSTSADLSIVKSGPIGEVLKGRPVSWTLRVTNNGPSDAQGVVISDLLPAEVDLGTLEIVDGGLGCTLTGSDVECVIPTVADGEEVVITLNAVLFDDVTAEDLTNEATVRSLTPDPDNSNDSSEAVNKITDVDISVDKTASASSVDFGDSVTFTIRVTNDGTSIATPLTVIDEVPAGLDVTAAGTTAGDCSIDGNTVTCEDLAVPADGGFIDVEITATATGNGPIVNVAQVECECLLSPITGSPAEVEIVRTADLEVSKVADATNVQPGTPVTYTITVTNEGPDPAPGVVLTDRLPGGMTLISSSPSTGTFDETTGVWTIGEMADGETVTLTVVASPDDVGMFTNVATVDSDAVDPDAADDTDDATITVLAVNLPRTGSDGFRIVWWAIGVLLAGAWLWLIATRGFRQRQGTHA